MHEFGLMQNIMDTAIERATTAGGHHIYEIEMLVGEASGVAPESLEMAFDVVKKGTMAEMAKLKVDRVATICYCSTCQIEFQPVDLLYECPQCHQTNTEILHGKEFEITSVEVS